MFVPGNRRWGRAPTCIVTVLMVLSLSLVALPDRATAATREYVNGQTQSVPFTYAFGLYDLLTGYYQSTTGYYAEVDSSHVPTGGWPKVGDLFYIHTVFTKIGGGGYTDSVQELSLPAGVQLAVGNGNEVRCSVEDLNGTRDATGTSGCPSNPRTGTGAQLDISLGSHVIGPNSAFEIRIPVRATTELRGLDSASELRFLSIADGNQRTPTARLYVPYATPAVSYPTTAATQVTQSSARLNAAVAAHYTGGPVYFDLGTAPGRYTQTKHAGDLPGGGDVYDVWEDFSGLKAGTTYHWRVRYETGGSTYYGQDQAFTTMPGRIAAPDTRISAARIDRRRHIATFKFGARGTSTRLECALARKAVKGRQPSPRYAGCRSPKTYRGLKHGSYTFYVRAVGPGGTDRSPATRDFRI